MRTIGAGARRMVGLVVSVVALLGMGCPSTTPHFEGPTPGTTKGVILVDSPEVYNRERLIQDRERQKEWLRTQLDVDDAAFDTFEALVQRRSSRSTQASLNADATPQMGLVIRQADASVAALQREQEIAQLEHELKVAELRQQLAKLEAGETIALPEASTTVGDAEDSDESSDATESSDTTDSTASSTGGSTALPSLPTLSLGTPGAKASPLSRFRDRLAFRELVRQEILENDLDDAHDLSGNTLYRWTFDATVFPEYDTSKWGVVQVDVPQQNYDCKSLESEQEAELRFLHKRWLRSLEETLEIDVQRVADALYRDQDFPELRDFLRGVESPRDLAELRARMIRKQREIDWLEGAEDPAARSHRNQLLTEVETLEQELRSLSRKKAADSVAKVYRQEPRVQSTALHIHADHGVVQAQLDKLPDFCALLASLDKRVEPYAVTPKETVQRIADLAAAQEASERALGLALAAGTVGLDAALKASRQEEFQRDSILRRPLVVGFGMPAVTNDSGAQDATVGWIIGPRFHPREAGFDFRHSPVQLALSAVLSIPAWWPSANIEVRTCWVSDDESPGGPATPPCKNGDVREHRVRLPGAPATITAALFPRARKPSPYLVGQTPELEIGRQETVVVFGQNLWRNPVVFLRGQRADKVEVLPDMEGVAVTFETVRQPAGWSLNQQFSLEPLWLWTSEGSAIAGDARVIKKAVPPKDSAPKPLFAIETTIPWIVSGKNHDGVIGLHISKKKDFPGDGKVHLSVEKADLDVTASSTVACLDKAKVPWEITPPCRFDLALRNLQVGEVVTLRTHRLAKEGSKPPEKIPHPPLSLEVR